MLLTSNFNSSDYIKKVEVTEALAKHEEGTAQIIPIMVSAVRPVEKIAKLHYLQSHDLRPINSCSDKEAVWTYIVTQIEKEVELWLQTKAADSSDISILRPKQMIETLKKKLQQSKGFDLCSRSGLGWNKDIQLLNLDFIDDDNSISVQEKENKKEEIRQNSRLLFLDPKSAFFTLDTNINWNAKSIYNTEISPKQKEKLVANLYNELTYKGYHVKTTSSILPPPFWRIVLDNNEGAYENALTEIPVWKKQYGGNLFFLTENHDTQALESYQKMFNTLWNNATKWSEHEKFADYGLTMETVIKILREAEEGESYDVICKRHNINFATFSHWKSKYGELLKSITPILKELEATKIKTLK